MKKKPSAKKLSLNKLVVTQLDNATRVKGGDLGFDNDLGDSGIKISNYITMCYADSYCASYLDGCFRSKECN